VRHIAAAGVLVGEVADAICRCPVVVSAAGDGTQTQWFPTMTMKPSPLAQVRRWQRAAVLAALLSAGAAHAQFSMVPAPEVPVMPRVSEAEIEKEYRIDAARHIYSAYPMRIYKGKLPPLLYGVMMVETEIDAAGQVLNVNVIRKPAAAEVGPWVVAMIRRAAPFPPPAKMAGGAKYMDIWLVDKSGQFQVDTLTEGQR
jgi:periplasmic protein TonB